MLQSEDNKRIQVTVVEMNVQTSNDCEKDSLTFADVCQIIISHNQVSNSITQASVQ